MSLSLFVIRLAIPNKFLAGAATTKANCIADQPLPSKHNATTLGDLARLARRVDYVVAAIKIGPLKKANN
jgi:hypothetical protein